MTKTIAAPAVPAAAFPKIYTVIEAAALLRIKDSTFRNGVRDGIYPQPVYISPRRKVWRESDLAAFIKAL